MPASTDRLLEVAIEAIAKLKTRVDGLPLPQKGEKGDKGDTGPKGPQGEKGERGEQGPKGDTGAQGEKGPQGEPGPKGEKGEIGPKGDTGERGPQGFAGRDGRDGQDGKDGAVGPVGPAGQDGTDGRDGRGVEKTEIKGTDLWITYTDGEEVNLGRVVGEDGVTQTVVRNRKAGEGGGGQQSIGKKFELSGFFFVILQSEHRTINPLVSVFNSQGEEVSSVVKITPIGDIEVSSLILLNNHFAIVK